MAGTPLEPARAPGSAVDLSTAAVDAYYTRCIPFYREFLGDHWHTGWYLPDGPTGPQDQLRLERRIAADAGIGAGCIVLDVGCGVGGPACHLAGLTGAQVMGVTPNETQLDIARDQARRRGMDARVRFECASADALPVEDGSIDVVLFLESPCHFPDRARFFAEAQRVLRAGGRIAGTDWLASPHAPGDEALLRELEAAWAIPALGTLAGYAHGLQRAGLELQHAVDLREEMPLHRGFLYRPQDREQVRAEAHATVDPVRRQIMHALVMLGEAVERGSFTVGRFLARRPHAG